MVSVRVKLHDFREPTGRRKDGPILPGHSSHFNLETAVGRKKAVKDTCFVHVSDEWRTRGLP